MLRSSILVIAILAAVGGSGAATSAAAQSTGTQSTGTQSTGTQADTTQQTITQPTNGAFDALMNFVLRPTEGTTPTPDDSLWNWQTEPGPSMLETQIGPPLLGPTGDEPIGPPLAGPVGKPMDLTKKTAPPPQESDPFAARGIRLGSFVIRPSIEVGATATTNVAGAKNGPGAVGWLLAPEIDISSKSDRHTLDANLNAEAVSYDRSQYDDRTINARISGSYDLTAATKIIGDAGFAQAQSSFSDQNTPGGAAARPKTKTYDATLGLEQHFGRFSVHPSGFVVRELNDDVPLTGGGVASRRELNYLEYGGRLRTAYTLGAGITPFTEVAVARRDHDQTVDDSGFRRSSLWGELRGGLVIDRGDKLSGEVSVGYRHEKLEDSRLPDVNAFLANASILWSPRRLTDVRVDLVTDTSTSSVPYESGSVVYSSLVTVSRKITPRIKLAGGGGVGYEYSVGNSWHDVTYTGFAEASYAFNRTASLIGRYEYDQKDSTLPGDSYKAHTVSVRLRLQR